MTQQPNNVQTPEIVDRYIALSEDFALLQDASRRFAHDADQRITRIRQMLEELQTGAIPSEARTTLFT